MQLRILSILGEALNFGGRRMETIMRVAWLPVALLFIVNMTTVLSILSISVERTITFAEVGSFVAAKHYYAKFFQQGLNAHPEMVSAVLLGSAVLQLAIVSSFLAPLIRYAGLGERPSDGIMRVRFGSDQLLFLIASIGSLFVVALFALAPALASSYFVFQYVGEALSKTMAAFPDPQSLHTIELVTAEQGFIEQGTDWIYKLAIPLAVAAPFALSVFLLALLHFRLSNRPNAHGKGNPFLRFCAVLFGVAIVGFVLYLFSYSALTPDAKLTNNVSNGGGATFFSGADTGAASLFLASAIMLFVYFAIRLAPYPGVAVCRRSLALGNTLRVTRGWNLFKLSLALFVLWSILLLVQIIVVNELFLNRVIPGTLNLLYKATAVSTRLVNSGVESDWVFPVFVWIYNIAKMLVHFFWAFFSYGVLAGLYGRLYRDSEREDIAL